MQCNIIEGEGFIPPTFFLRLIVFLRQGCALSIYFLRRAGLLPPPRSHAIIPIDRKNYNRIIEVEPKTDHY